jgi:NAD-dependent deacetylase
MDIDFSSRIELSASLLKRSKYAVAFTGAGISTASGIPDFRSPGKGLWVENDPFEVASLSAFRNHPEKFYNWIKPLFLQARSAKPNPAHIFLSRMENIGIIKSIITQNIDGLHQESGARLVIELHGSARTATCPNCRSTYDTDHLFELLYGDDNLPTCSQCGHIIKPDVVLFEEMLPEKAWHSAHQEVQRADLILVIGSSLEVYPASTLPEIAIRNGAKLIINTLSKTPMDLFADVLLPINVIESIPRIFQMIES